MDNQEVSIKLCHGGAVCVTCRQNGRFLVTRVTSPGKWYTVNFCDECLEKGLRLMLELIDLGIEGEQ